MLHCLDCDLRFRGMLQADYAALYDNESVDAWSLGPLRTDQRLVIALVQAHVAAQPQARTVLDFGCYTGEFLARLPAQLQRHGVEVSAAAGAVAAQEADALVKRSFVGKAAVAEL